MHWLLWDSGSHEVLAVKRQWQSCTGCHIVVEVQRLGDPAELHKGTGPGAADVFSEGGSGWGQLTGWGGSDLVGGEKAEGTVGMAAQAGE